MTKLSYEQRGDYLIPQLSLVKQPNKPLGKYGRMSERYLKQYRKGLWTVMLLNGTLPAHLREIDETAQRRLDDMIPAMMEKTGVTEKMKEEDPLEWVRQMNNLKAQAEEVILKELIYD